MAFAFVTNGPSVATVNATSLTVTLNASPVTNNILLAHVDVQAAGLTITVGGGWTIIDSDNSNGMSSAVAWHLVDGSQAAPVFSWGSLHAATGMVFEFSGNLLVTPVGASFSHTAGASALITGSGFTTSADNSFAITVFMTSGAQTIPLQTGWTNANVINNSNGSYRLQYANVYKSGSVVENASAAITSANWKAFQYELVGSGSAPANEPAVRSSQVTQLTAENYSNPTNIFSSQVTLLTLRNLIVNSGAIQLNGAGSLSANTLQIQRGEHWIAGTMTNLGWVPVSTTSLNSLASNNAVLSDFIFNNGTYLDIFCDLSVNLASAAFVAPASIGVYIYPLGPDGATFGDGRFVTAAAGPPPANYLVGTINLVALTQAQSGTVSGILMPPGTFRFVLWNNTGVAWAAGGNSCQMRTYNRILS